MCVALVCAAHPPGAAAQQQTPPDFQIRRAVNVVDVSVTVRDARGQFVRNLTAESFRVLDNGAPQPLTNFTAIEAPAQILVLAETSPAVYLLSKQHLIALELLAANLAPADSLALASYDTSVHSLLDFTTDKRAFLSATGRLHFNLGMAQLRLYDALSACVDLLAAQPGKKAILLLSTGIDTSEAARWRELEKKLYENSVTVYAVALGGELRDFRGAQPGPDSGREVSFSTADKALREIAAGSGGQAFFPRAAKEFPAMYRQIAGFLRNQYSLGFAPPARDGQVHRIEVQVLDAQRRVTGASQTSGATSKPAAAQKQRGTWEVRARPGYLAPPP